MSYFAVHSGNILRCVLADDPKAACVAAVTLHCQDEYTEECIPGKVFHVAEPGQSSGDNIFILSEHILDAGGFQVVESE